MTKNPVNAVKKAEIKAIVERMMQAYRVADKKQLAQALNCKINTIHNWSHFGRIPHDQLAQCRKQTGKTLDWLVYGESPEASGLTEQEQQQLLTLMAKVIEGALDYEMIRFVYPDAGEKMLNKLKKDLQKWQRSKTPALKDQVCGSG